MPRGAGLQGSRWTAGRIDTSEGDGYIYALLPPPRSSPSLNRVMDGSERVVVILVTAPDKRVATRLARALVEERLAACVNVLPGVTSLYRWEGAVQQEGEVLLVIKARGRDVEAIGARVTELHPYDVPEVVATEVVGGSRRYLDWIQAETERE